MRTGIVEILGNDGQSLWTGLDDGRTWGLVDSTDHLDCASGTRNSRSAHSETDSILRALGSGRSAGVVAFTQDPTGTPSATGDALCVLAAIFYATYDLRLFSWGKKVAPRRLITSKIGTQALLSAALLLTLDWQASFEWLSSDPNWAVILPVVLWSGVAVNAVAPFLQVGGQQAVGPTRCQTIYASQPLWAGFLSFVFLGETIGIEGAIGGTAFLSALFLAATAEAPDADCGETNCEV
jgi:drug/metabolite transporter (DMT)-like permease